jgi:Flp pilus assembly protein TadB
VRTKLVGGIIFLVLAGLTYGHLIFLFFLVWGIVFVLWYLKLRKDERNHNGL